MAFTTSLQAHLPLIMRHGGLHLYWITGKLKLAHKHSLTLTHTPHWISNESDYNYLIDEPQPQGGSSYDSRTITVPCQWHVFLGLSALLGKRDNTCWCNECLSRDLCFCAFYRSLEEFCWEADRKIVRELARSHRGIKKGQTITCDAVKIWRQRSMGT